MASQTTNYLLNKPQTTDQMSDTVNKLASDMDTLDTTIHTEKVRIDNLVLGTGTSTAETVDARSSAVSGSYSVLKDRLDAMEKRYFVDTAVTDAYVINASASGVTLYTGLKLNILVNTTNTGAATLSINNGSTFKSIVRDVSSTLHDGDIVANRIMEVIYDGINWRLVNATITGISGGSPSTVF